MSRLVRSSRLRQGRGFTLVELLLASTAMLVIAAATYASMRLAFKARDRALAAVGPARSAEIAMDAVRRNIESALPPRGLLEGSFLGTTGTETPETGAVEFYQMGPRPRIGQTAESHDRAQRGASESQRLDATTFGGVQRVDLLVAKPQNDPNGQPALIRRITRNLLAPTDPTPDEEIICRNVTEFTLRYFDGFQWTTDWDSTQYGDVLPLAVEVTLAITGPADPTQASGGEDAAAAANRVNYRTMRTFLLPCRDEAALSQGVTQ
jgi:prepilin-type N-terminal cleavage/methylation domain-containing protein